MEYYPSNSLQEKMTLNAFLSEMKAVEDKAHVCWVYSSLWGNTVRLLRTSMLAAEQIVGKEPVGRLLNSKSTVNFSYSIL